MLLLRRLPKWESQKKERRSGVGKTSSRGMQSSPKRQSQCVRTIICTTRLTSLKLPEPIHGLYLYSNTVVALSTSGSLTLLGPELNILHSDTTPSGWTVFKAFWIAADPTFTVTPTLVVVEISIDASRIRVVGFPQDGSVNVLGDTSLTLKPSVRAEHNLMSTY